MLEQGCLSAPGGPVKMNRSTYIPFRTRFLTGRILENGMAFIDRSLFVGNPSLIRLRKSPPATHRVLLLKVFGAVEHHNRCTFICCRIQNDTRELLLSRLAPRNNTKLAVDRERSSGKTHPLPNGGHSWNLRPFFWMNGSASTSLLTHRWHMTWPPARGR